MKDQLVGNVARASAFVSYCGPFNAEFRQMLSNEYFVNDLNQRGVPCSEDFDI